MGTDVTRWADSAQYPSEPATSTTPVVTLLNATNDPLGSVAALTAMYTGRVVRSLAELTVADRKQALLDMMRTELSGPLEAAQFHFLIENVSRAWTHQAVRNRYTFFAQESMRFAVVEDWDNRVPNPAGFERWSAEAQQMWVSQLHDAKNVYEFLVNSGVPAEDARGLMPHAITTRLHMVVDLRTLIVEAGKRTCTQAQFEWRMVFAGIAKAIRGYRLAPYFQPRQSGWCMCGYVYGDARMMSEEALSRKRLAHEQYCDAWQFEAIADLMRPVCYQKNACGFMASMDRGCTIRARVDANARIGRESDNWNEGWQDPFRPQVRVTQEGVAYSAEGDITGVQAINPAEWAADPGAARVKP